ncbi:unnamed protein product [Sphacelaria rigidula]
MKPRPTAPFPGWRKPVGARSHLFGTDNDALRFGHPRSDWKKRAIPSGSSINNDDVPHTLSLSRAEGRREDPDDESSSSPVLLVTTGGGSCVFTGMTDCSVGGTAESTETTVETVNADTAHSIDDRPQVSILEPLDANVKKTTPKQAKVIDGGPSMRVGETLRLGEVLTPKGGGVQLRQDAMGSIVLEQTDGTQLDADEESGEVWIEPFRSTGFSGQPVKKGFFEKWRRRRQGKDQRQRKTFSCPSEEATRAGITCQQVQKKPRWISEKSRSMSQGYLRVTNRGELEIMKGFEVVTVKPAELVEEERGLRRWFSAQKELYLPESQEYELRVVDTGFEVWLGTVRVWGFQAFSSEGGG